MKPTLCTITLLTTIPLLASPVFASINDWEDTREDNESFASQKSPRPYGNYTHDTSQMRKQADDATYTEDSADTSFSAEPSVGVSCCDYVDYIVGTTVRYAFWAPSSAPLPDTNIKPELFVSGRLGGGCGDDNWGDDNFLLIGTVCIGGDIQLRFNNVVSAFVRAEIGVGFAYAETECWDDTDDTDFGLAYSIGVGLQFDIIPGRQSVICGIDYIGMTAQPNTDVAVSESGIAYHEKIDEPAFVLFSVGYKWSF